MTMNKADMVETISSQCGFSKAKSTQLLESMLELIKASLESGENVLLSGFGKFSVNSKDARRGRNPATGDDIKLAASRAVTFGCSPVLREKMNGRGKP